VIRIDTQDVILGKFATERLIEIGPADTLINMAKKTINAEYKSQDAANCLKRELLSYKKQSSAIYYQSELVDIPESAASKAPVAAAPALAITLPVAPIPAAAQSAAPASASIPDKDVTALDKLLTLVSFTLKQSRSEVVQDRTLKQLCGGKSFPSYPPI
jgi:fatty acid synthase subunit alpha